ncbi:MAG: PilZ domain-containing protein [Deltaproteobacteria bacterium]|nr:PilZ domain-containing protein [Deltaproteobacteria bacterium]
MTTPQPVPCPVVEERRKTPRRAVEAHITASSQTNFYCGFTEDLSEGGVFIAMTPCPGVGELVHLSVRVGSEPPVTAIGEVRWQRRDDRGEPVGCGVQFVMVEPRAAELLQGLLGVAGQAPLLVDI